jgi:cytochrome c biogenesis protein CcmG/thiol:disulfide interchange protein DsbE
MDNNNWVEDRLKQLEPQFEPRVSIALARVETRRHRGQIRDRGLRILALAGIVGVCSLFFPQPRAVAARCVEACENLPDDFHDHLHQLIWSVHSFLGVAPPDFALVDDKGQDFRLSESFGNVILLNFWATWCRPCKEEAPWFAEFQRTYKGHDFTVIGVAMDEDGWKLVRPFMTSLGLNYRVAIGDKALAQQYGLSTLPQTLLIGRKGQVLTRHAGITEKEQFERDIVRALWSSMSQTEREQARAKGLAK